MQFRPGALLQTCCQNVNIDGEFAQGVDRLRGLEYFAFTPVTESPRRAKEMRTGLSPRTGNGERDRGWTQTFVVSELSQERKEHQQVSPSADGWNNLGMARQTQPEPVMGNGRPGKPGRVASSVENEKFGSGTPDSGTFNCRARANSHWRKRARLASHLGKMLDTCRVRLQGCM